MRHSFLCVVSATSIRSRVSLQECLALQNYSSCLEVLSALQQTPVQRLRETWSDVSSKLRKSFDDMVRSGCFFAS
jgi:hypothetical protein